MEGRPMRYRIRQGIVPGRNHMLDARNCQDAMYSSSFEVDEQAYTAGVIADGCGEGEHSEVGAQLAVRFIIHAIRRSVQDGVAFEHLPDQLFDQLLHFLKVVTNTYSFADVREMVTFVNDHLLFTVLGFIVGPAQTIV